jgi:hypothetical protein
MRTGQPYGATSPSELWAVENNLNIANMDWQEFAAAVDEDGVIPRSRRLTEVLNLKLLPMRDQRVRAISGR